MDTSPNSTSPSDGSGSNKLSDNVAIAALVFSLVAMLTVMLQFVQTIIATAKGLPNCDKEVMGLWADFVHKRLRWFRLEVQYEAPVIFLASTNNEHGAVERSKIWYVDGSVSSCRETRVMEPIKDPEDMPGTGEDPPVNSSGLVPERVSTANHELATWVTLIEAVQKMERDSSNWEKKKWLDLSQKQPALLRATTLAIAIQSLKRSFDKHPVLKKPYATTAICHIVELAAVLGIYWKEFNHAKNEYRAEGNGYSLSGYSLNEFGIVFVFEKSGWPRFKKHRVIPTSEIKELCFGNVPTFYRDRDDDENWKTPINEQDDLQTLQLGSREEIAQTLNLIGCNAHTTLYYLDEGKKHIHLFPVIFEVLGMLARTLHITHRPFTRLPNPVMFSLNKQAFSLRRLLAAFSHHLNEEVERATYQVPKDLITIQAFATSLNEELPDQDSDYSPIHLDKLHSTLDGIDTVLNATSTSVVLDVVRRHIQEMLLAINNLAKGVEKTIRPIPTMSTADTRTVCSEIIGGEISFDDFLRVPPENRELEFMQKYFGEVRVRVISTDSGSHHDPRATKASQAIHTATDHQKQEQQQPNDVQDENGQHHWKRDDATASPSQPPFPAETSASQPSSPLPIGMQGRTPTIPQSLKRADTEMSYATTSTTWGAMPLNPTEVRRNVIWCALVFRMLCWLSLHDFDKRDIQLPKSEMIGSRLPAFII